MKQRTIAIVGLTLSCAICAAQEKADLKDEKDRINYSVGYQIGGDFKRQGVELNPEALVRGIQDALGNANPLMTQDEMRTTLVNLKRKIVAEEEQKRKARIERVQEEGRKFLAENAKKEGVVTLPSGLQYKVLQEGSGKQPDIKDTVAVNYRGTRIDGTEFDSSYRNGKPATFPLSKVIPGWKEALLMMKEGAKWQLFIPPKHAFGRKGPLEEQTVVYEIELIRIDRPEKTEP